MNMQSRDFGTANRYWDGVHRSYIPGAELVLPDSLQLHSGAETQVDPVTFEVIRYALINANLEHSRLIQRLSVSPIVMIARDFQTSILTEIGDLVVLGPNVQYFANAQSLATKWVMENRAVSPGIRAGDMFLSNDPFVGTAHHQDTNLMLPLFIGDELFCWVANTLHFADVGGTSPGSFCIGAEDAWSDPPAFPGIRIVEGGRIRDDIEQVFLRQSRLRVTVQMDLRAAISAAQTAARGIAQLVERYGADTVKQVMRDMMTASAELFRERLLSIPDGRWSARSYVESSVPSDRGIYRYQLNLEKRGGQLIVDNRGTDPQAGAINCTFAPLSGSFLASAVQALVPDLAGCFGGAYSCVEFNLESGLLNCAQHPAAVSPSGAATSEIAVNLSTILIGKMLSCGDDAARSRMIGVPQPAFYAHIYAGLDGKGTPFVDPTSDNMIGSQGGTATADGIDAGGSFWLIGAIAENIEQSEDAYPLLCLFRRFQQGGEQGAGRHRGGLGTEICTMPWHARHFQIELATNEAFVRANGLSGGNPGGMGATRILRNSQGADFAFPDLSAGITDGEDAISPKALGLVLGAGDMTWWSCSATGGYGDPLLRSPQACLDDVSGGMFGAEAVRQVYGVVLGEQNDGTLAIDKQATGDLRAARFAERLGRQPGPLKDLSPAARMVGDCLALHDGHWHCANCAHDLGDAEQPYKALAHERRLPIDSFAPGFESPHPDLADAMELREFLCANCGVRLETEIAMRTDDMLDDIRLT